MKFISNARYGEPVENGTIFECKIGSLSVAVHQIIHCDGWFLTCRSLGIAQKRLEAKTLIGAIEESKNILKAIVEGMMNDVSLFCEQEAEISRY